MSRQIEEEIQDSIEQLNRNSEHVENSQIEFTPENDQEILDLVEECNTNCRVSCTLCRAPFAARSARCLHRISTPIRVVSS